MALIRMGGIIGAISGNLGGLNFSKSRAGPFVRSRKTAIARNTERQLQQRALFATVSQDWSQLTDEQRNGWNRFAALTQRTNRLGITKPYAGFTVYCEHNMFALKYRGNSRVASPLTPRTTPPTAIDVVMSEGGPYTITTLPGLPAGPSMAVLFASRPVSPRPRTAFRSWNFIRTTLAASPPLGFTSEFDAILGPPKETERIGLRMVYQLGDHLPSFHFQSSIVVGP